MKYVYDQDEEREQRPIVDIASEAGAKWAVGSTVELGSMAAGIPPVATIVATLFGLMSGDADVDNCQICPGRDGVPPDST